MTQVFDPAQELQRSAELFLKRPLLGLPLALVSVAAVVAVFVTLIGTVIAVFAGAGHAPAGAALLGVLPSAGTALAFIAAGYVFGGLLTMCATPYVLADRPIDWHRALAVAADRFWQFGLLWLVTAAATIFVLPFCIVLVGIPVLLALWYFLTYAAAAVAIDGETAMRAIETSFRIARTRVPETVVAWLGLIVAFVAGTVANGILGHVPLVNVVAAFLIGGFTATYSEVVRVRFYLALRVPGVPSTLTANVYAAPPAPPSPYVPPYVPPSGI